MRNSLIVFAVAILSACVGSSVQNTNPAPVPAVSTNSVTLRVVNKGYYNYKVYTNNYGTKVLLGSVYSNESRCFRLANTQDAYQLIIENGNGSYLTPQFIPSTTSYGGWSMVLNDMPSIDGYNLQPFYKCKV